MSSLTLVKVKFSLKLKGPNILYARGTGRTENIGAWDKLNFKSSLI